MKSLRSLFLFALFSMISSTFYAQKIQYARSFNKDGLHVFEPSQVDEKEYEGLKLQIGAGFRQSYQMLRHENANPTGNPNQNLYALGNGFNLAAANLNIQVQLEDGIQILLENYMASRHHNEFWVKGGYIQIDKLPMFDNPEWFTKYVRMKIGHMEINYGDTHFRRSDGGNAMHNPFIENNIMDQFTTEIGGELYIFPAQNFMFMVGLTNGLIKHDVRDYSTFPIIGTGLVDSVTSKNPSLLLKGVYDKTTDDLRFRLSASMYHNASSPRISIYGGDRTGSGYFGVLENSAWTNSTAQFTSGRFDPRMNNSLTALMLNPFIKYKGLEFFGTYENAVGKNVNEAPEAHNGKDRRTTQVSGELIYRFLKHEDAYVGTRYNTITSRLQGGSSDVTINRFALAAGWYPTKNLLLKGEWVNQAYDGFGTNSIFNEGKFNGMVIEAVVGF
ncbi:MAG TPA: hypothetical protein PKC30_00375 [Saprospiraceae bacterium]|nr:hypothetical protein [Saprospiraceae bacterium]